MICEEIAQEDPRNILLHHLWTDQGYNKEQEVGNSNNQKRRLTGRLEDWGCFHQKISVKHHLLKEE